MLTPIKNAILYEEDSEKVKRSNVDPKLYINYLKRKLFLIAIIGREPKGQFFYISINQLPLILFA